MAVPRIIVPAAIAMAAALPVSAPARGAVPAGTIRTAGADLASPWGVSGLADGTMFVASRSGNHVVSVDTDGAIAPLTSDNHGFFGGDFIPILALSPLMALAEPEDVSAIPGGGFLFADRSNNRIRKVDTLGFVSTVAGTGLPGTDCNDGSVATVRLNHPGGVVAIDATRFLVADTDDNCVRLVQSGAVQRIAGLSTGQAGNGADVAMGRAAALEKPAKVAYRADGRVLIADTINGKVRELSGPVVSATITTLASGLSRPGGVAPTEDGGIFVSEMGAHRVSYVPPGGGAATPVAGDGTACTRPSLPCGDSAGTVAATSAQLREPRGLSTASDGDLLIADSGDDRIRRVHWVPAPPPDPQPTTTTTTTPDTPPTTTTASSAPPPATPAQAGGSPVVATTEGVALESGTATVRTPGKTTFAPLRPGLVADGTEIDTTKGVVRLTIALPVGGTAVARVSLGRFVVRQRKDGLVDLRLSGALGGCVPAKRDPGSAGAQAAKKKPPKPPKKRTLRVDHEKGKFRTDGKYASAIVRGTDWSTTDDCSAKRPGTLVRVRRGAVSVRDFRLRKTILVRAGKSYFARARG